MSGIIGFLAGWIIGPLPPLLLILLVIVLAVMLLRGWLNERDWIAQETKRAVAASERAKQAREADERWWAERRAEWAREEEERRRAWLANPVYDFYEKPHD